MRELFTVCLCNSRGGSDCRRSSQDRGTGDETVVSNARLQLERISSRLYM